MSTAEEAQAGHRRHEGKDLGGRALTVNVAKPREERPAGAAAAVGVNSAAAAVAARNRY